MKLKPATYRTFLDSIQNGSVSDLSQKSASIIEHFRPAKQIVSHFAPITFLLDYATKKYIYMGEACFNLLGYSVKWFLENGLEEFLSKWHEADFEVINTKVFPDNLEFFKTLRSAQFNDYIISYNYRLRNPKGEYVTLLQRSSFIPGSAGPAGVIGVAFDITHYKNDTTIVHTIEKVVTNEHGTVNELIFKKIHPVYDFFEIEGKQFLSKREVEILKSVSAGLSSKQIADKMRLSINTVNNHRRNMLAKIGCKSSAELMNYAVKHGLL